MSAELSHLHEYTLGGDEDITVLIALVTVVFDGHFPFAYFLVPRSTNDLGVELEVPVQIPFLDSALDVGEDFRTTRIELLPVWVWIERKCLVPLVTTLRTTDDDRYSHRCVLGHRIERRDSDWRTTFRQHRLGPRIWYARLCSAWQEICVGTCVP